MPDLRLADVIDSVADGAEVNWAEVTSAAHTDHERRLLDDLRTVADIAHLHRVLATAPEADTVPPLDLSSWGDLEILEPLGTGAFGQVFLARDQRLGRYVALKLLAEHLGSRMSVAAQLLDEARILARVQHPNVVVVHGAGVHEGRAGFWMEYVAGETLEDRLAKDGPLGPGEAAAVGAQVCRALAAVHNAGLIHRDVKARNIMRERGGRLVLMDFGAGVTIEHAPGTAGTRIGTPAYLAPETLAGESATVRSDLYAVGVLLYHLVSGQFPYAADTLDELRAAQHGRPPVALQDRRPDLPAGLVGVIEKALAPVEQRFQSAGEMAAALERVIMPAAPAVRQRQRLLGLGAVGALAAGIIATVAFWPAENGPRSPAISVHSLAVMPFVNQTGQPSLEGLASGIARDVQRQLRRLRVPVKGGVPGGPPRVLEAAVFAREAAADAVVAADLTRTAPGRFDLSVRVLEAGGSPLWTRLYRTGERDVSGVGHSVAIDIARAMGVTPASGSPQPRMPFPAYDAYQRGRTLAELRKPTSLQRSIEYYKEAIRLAPEYAEPYAGLADSYIALGVPTFGTLSPREARQLANEAAVSAVERDPDSPEAHTSLAFISYFYDWDWPAAERRFRRAIDLDPQYGLAHAWYADFLNAMGRHPEALAEVQQALDLEPQSLLYHRDVAWHAFFQRRYEDAVGQLRRTLERDPDYVPARSLLGRALVANGQVAEGLEELRRVAPQLPRPTGLLFVAQAEASAGMGRQARRHLHEAIALAPAEYVSPVYVALACTALGEPAPALDWLRRGYDTQDPTMVNVYSDPRLDSLRGRPEFQDLLRRMRFPSVTAPAPAATASPH